MSFAHISAFLQDPDVAHDTRLSWKAHMPRLLDWLEESNERGPWYAQQRRQVLKFIKFRRQDSGGGGSRSKRALSKSEADALMDVWAHDTRPVALRNTALLRLMVYTGLRRAELVALEVQVGDNAAPAASDPKYGGEFLIGSYRPQIMTGGAVMFTATLKPATGDAPEWGAV